MMSSLSVGEKEVEEEPRYFPVEIMFRLGQDHLSEAHRTLQQRPARRPHTQCAYIVAEVMLQDVEKVAIGTDETDEILRVLGDLVNNVLSDMDENKDPNPMKPLVFQQEVQNKGLAGGVVMVVQGQREPAPAKVASAGGPPEEATNIVKRKAASADGRPINATTMKTRKVMKAMKAKANRTRPIATKAMKAKAMKAKAMKANARKPRQIAPGRSQ